MKQLSGFYSGRDIDAIYVSLVAVLAAIIRGSVLIAMNDANDNTSVVKNFNLQSSAHMIILLFSIYSKPTM